MIVGSLEKYMRQVDYTLLRYRLRFEEDFYLPAYALLRLRRELTRVVKSGRHKNLCHAESKDLLQPPLPTDPGLLRRVQQPAPGFILHIDRLQSQRFCAGESQSLTVCFFARGKFQVESFTRLLEALGPVGLFCNTGRFQLESIEDASALSGNQEIWSGGPFPITATISDLTLQLESFSAESVTLELLTPARLLSNSRPLFRPDFVDIFPFILRRVTGMLAAWAELEEVFDVSYLLECAARLVVADNRLKWQDWRPMQKHEEVGGVCGSVLLSGSELTEIWPILRLGELFGIGKGAAFGAGRYRLISSDNVVGPEPSGIMG